MVESQRTIGEKTSVENRFYISSRQADAEKMAQCCRGHWGIENSLHWVLDVAFQEDQCRIRKNSAEPHNNMLTPEQKRDEKKIAKNYGE